MKLRNAIGGALALGAVAGTDVQAAEEEGQSRLSALLRPTPVVTIYPDALYSACTVKDGVRDDAKFQNVVTAAGNFEEPLSDALRMPSRRSARETQAAMTRVEVAAVVNKNSVDAIGTKISTIYSTLTSAGKEDLIAAIESLREINAELAAMEEIIGRVVDSKGRVSRVRGDYRAQVRRATVEEAFDNELNVMQCGDHVVTFALDHNDFPTIGEVISELGGTVENSLEGDEGDGDKAEKEDFSAQSVKELGVTLLTRTANAAKRKDALAAKVEAFEAEYSQLNGL